ncbi:unnamed protein product [Diatraea saccharalis]|uniref:DUF4789 domain-containing protein n=1 Tax=Diatraea saccharalis TaxID=40085 RepID=A0A9N9R463_9NEOP|nr:unnamed protein product [Diatraea saccharalis]
MKYLMSVLNVMVMIGEILTDNNVSKNSIGFPEIEENNNLKNKDNRQPVFMPATCPPNELYYPGDQKDDWICDCRPAFLYHPQSDSCWSAFQRGPCAVNEYLILPKDSVIPICVKNPCGADTYVIFNGKCEMLGSISACAHLYPIVAAVGVNATTLEIDCVKLNLESRFGEGQPVPTVDRLGNCQPGSKSSVNRKCDKIKI